MSSLLKSLTALLAYLGRGAVPVDGMYFVERARPAAAACGPNGVVACTPRAPARSGERSARSAQPFLRTGYRVLM